MNPADNGTNRAGGAKARIRVELWTDFICPWCGIGERRFAEALSAFPHRSKVELVRRSFRLMPGEAPRAVEEMLAGKYGLSPQEVAATLARLEATALEAGLTYHLGGSIAGDTTDAHRLLRFAREHGREDELHHRIFMAAMGERASIYDPEALTELAVSCGLDREETRAFLSGGHYADAIAADEAAMRERGGNSVPFFVFNGARQYAGALSPGVFLEALRKTWEESAAHDEAVAAGESCGPGGCALP